MKTARQGPWYGWNQDEAFDDLFTRNGLPEIAIEAGTKATSCSSTAA